MRSTRTPRLLRPALVFGRVPLFYFVLHLTLIHLLAVALCYAQIRRRALDVRVAQPRRVSLHAPAGLGCVAAGDLSDLAAVWCVTLYRMRVVRSGEATEYGLVVELFVTRQSHFQLQLSYFASSVLSPSRTSTSGWPGSVGAATVPTASIWPGLVSLGAFGASAYAASFAARGASNQTISVPVTLRAGFLHARSPCRRP